MASRRASLQFLLALSIPGPGCGRLDFDRSPAVADGASDAGLAPTLDGAPDAAPVITRVQTIHPANLDAAAVSAQITLTAGDIVIVIPY